MRSIGALVLLVVLTFPSLASARITASSCSCQCATINHEYRDVLGSLLANMPDIQVHVREVLLAVDDPCEVRIEATGQVDVPLRGRVYHPLTHLTITVRRGHLAICAKLLESVGPAKGGQFWITISSAGKYTRVKARSNLFVAVDLPRTPLLRLGTQAGVNKATQKVTARILRMVICLGTKGREPGQLLESLLDAFLNGEMPQIDLIDVKIADLKITSNILKAMFHQPAEHSRQ
jgi:hypothetical protein